ncbi:hypothetical protein AVEN_190179-1 [Araneus ventricosus]|uniref:Uncharacterized protein n=1 Tax=Araneus ventricosus TaxID=182803 RepID=A0A4Y2PAQ8_ARAVE|nr:hypothetical protein AVEN_190179-1 [Araneus ventricosus]
MFGINVEEYLTADDNLMVFEVDERKERRRRKVNEEDNPISSVISVRNRRRNWKMLVKKLMIQIHRYLYRLQSGVALVEETGVQNLIPISLHLPPVQHVVPPVGQTLSPLLSPVSLVPTGNFLKPFILK